MRILLGGIAENDAEIVSALPGDAVPIFAATLEEMIESIYASSPDLLMIGSEVQRLPDVLQRVCETWSAPILVIMSGKVAVPIPAARVPDLFGCLYRPLTAAGVDQAIRIAIAQYQRLAQARLEIDELREAFAARKIIDRAKGLVMQRRQMSEGEAYAYLREESRRQRTPIVEVARILLDGIDGSSGAIDNRSSHGNVVRRQHPSTSAGRVSR